MNTTAFAVTPFALLPSTQSSSFTSPAHCPLAYILPRSSRRVHTHSARTRVLAVAGGAPPPPSSGDESDDPSKSNDANDPTDSGLPKDASSSPSSSADSTRSDDGSRDAEFNLDLSTIAGSEKVNELFSFVKSIPPPEMVQRFTQSAPPVVQNAIRETLVSMLGSLPPMAFSTNISTMSPNLVQLFHSSLVTGYMFRNASYRLELTRTLDWSGRKALPSPDEQPEIDGGVAVFKQGDGSTVEVPVEEYISELRQTVSDLRSELQRERQGGNELLSFISTMEKDSLESLTKNAGDEVVEAMKMVCDYVTEAQGIKSEEVSVVETTAPELGQLLFYLMVSGFFMREAEVHLDLQRKLGGDVTNLNNLLEGDSDKS